ncbi:hypothetical protein H920_11489 [Fukomys damarensis]|uniref:Uncharacterized protein n=1 Tax=Fukomys damarensis TaxID=885580 RepID=A0A091D4R0_FUKDA|nr:hypothetical protein H920_11489 [Fukomys damarensis]
MAPGTTAPEQVFVALFLLLEAWAAPAEVNTFQEVLAEEMNTGAFGYEETGLVPQWDEQEVTLATHYDPLGSY